MHGLRNLGLGLAVACALTGGARAHTILVDGLVEDWSVRAPAQANLGIVARDGTSGGEYVFADAIGDHRTDVPGTTENDMTRVQITGDATNLYFLVRAGGVSAEPAQVQITIDTDRIAGSGQTFLAGFADTVVVEAARWEYLVQTQLSESPAGSGAHVYDTAFTEVADATAVQNLGGDIEIAVAWSALGFAAGPPSAPLRFTVSTYVASGTSDQTVDIGGPSISNAFDAIGDCGDARSAGYPNAWDCDLSDADLDYHVDVWFEPDGDVYAPLLVTHFVANASAPEPAREWIAIRNVSPGTIDLAGVRVGDEETPDQAEGMYTLPAVSLAAGATATIAMEGDDYLAVWGELPTIELTDASAAPHATPDLTWATGTWGLADAGDQILVVDRASTILDLVNYNTGTSTGGNYGGVTPWAQAGDLAENQVVFRNPATQDTDNNAADFTTGIPSCASEADCAFVAACGECVTNLCAPFAPGTSCADANACNGAETCGPGGTCMPGENAAAGTVCGDVDVCNGTELCNGLGTCVPGAPLVCVDADPCSADACDPAAGCVFPPAADGTACGDADLCDGSEICLSGMCVAGTPEVCDDGDPCNGVETCDPVTGGCVPGTPIPGCDVDAGLPDAAVPDAAAPDAAEAPDAGLADAGGPPDARLPADAAIPGGDDEGCGCRAGGASSGNVSAAAILAIAALSMFFTRRRRNR